MAPLFLDCAHPVAQNSSSLLEPNSKIVAAKPGTETMPNHLLEKEEGDVDSKEENDVSTNISTNAKSTNGISTNGIHPDQNFPPPTLANHQHDKPWPVTAASPGALRDSPDPLPFMVQKLSRLRKSGHLSDVSILVGTENFALHWFPLILQSRLFEHLKAEGNAPPTTGHKLVQKIGRDEWELCDFPGGAETFSLVADFCYGSARALLTPTNILPVRCAAQVLGMSCTDTVIGDGSPSQHSALPQSSDLVTVAETYLEKKVYASVDACLAVLDTCSSSILFRQGMELGILQRCCALIAEWADAQDKNELPSKKEAIVMRDMVTCRFISLPLATLDLLLAEFRAVGVTFINIANALTTIGSPDVWGLSTSLAKSVQPQAASMEADISRDTGRAALALLEFLVSAMTTTGTGRNCEANACYCMAMLGTLLRHLPFSPDGTELEDMLVQRLPEFEALAAPRLGSFEPAMVCRLFTTYASRRSQEVSRSVDQGGLLQQDQRVAALADCYLLWAVTEKLLTVELVVDIASCLAPSLRQNCDVIYEVIVRFLASNKGTSSAHVEALCGLLDASKMSEAKVEKAVQNPLLALPAAFFAAYITLQNRRIQNMAAQLKEVKLQVSPQTSAIAVAGSESSVPARDGSSNGAAQRERIRLQALKGSSDIFGVAMGLIYNQEGEGSRAFASAAELFSRAAEQGHAGAQWELAEMYYWGLGVAKNEEKRKLLIIKSAEHGFAPGIGWCYSQGWDTKSDKAKAAEYFLEAAAAGHAGAQNVLGYSYEMGLGVARDLKKAAFWYQKAAGQDHVVGQTWFGMCLYAGKGVAQDKKKAGEWFQKATRDNVRASRELGIHFYNGVHVPRDFKKAVAYFKRAVTEGDPLKPADRGHMAEAYRMLGCCYRDGHGLTRNKEQAVEHLHMSVELGNMSAHEELKQLTKVVAKHSA